MPESMGELDGLISVTPIRWLKLDLALPVN